MDGFEQRLFKEAQKVYAEIVAPDRAFNPAAKPIDVEAACMDAHLKASTEPED